jgi:hypothetical protein
LTENYRRDVEYALDVASLITAADVALTQIKPNQAEKERERGRWRGGGGRVGERER